MPWRASLAAPPLGGQSNVPSSTDSRQVLVRLKDPVPVEEHKGVVYFIPCVECSSVQIGQTGRSLKQCVSEYHSALKNGDIQASAMEEYVFKTGHAVDLRLSKVLDHCHHTTTHYMLESWCIQHEQGAGNPTGSVLGAPGLMSIYQFIT